MHEPDLLFDRIESGNFEWSDLEQVLKFSKKDVQRLYQISYEMKLRKFGRDLKIYIPNKRFPAISITGNQCHLNCSHCNKKYLDSMVAALTNEELESFLFKLSQEGGVGALISGGCEPDGSVPLLNFINTIKKIKDETDLIINAHTGLLNEVTAKGLADAKVDIISFDINADEEIIREIYHLEKNVEDYKTAVELLKKYELNIVPHICIGLHHGKIHKELDSLKFIKDLKINPSLIVIIALIPPKESEIVFEKPDSLDIGILIAITRILFPDSEISLGCMRPRGNVKIDIEKHAIKAGITRIEIPSKKTLKWFSKLQPKSDLKFYSACCAIPIEFENKATSLPSDIKNYQI